MASLERKTKKVEKVFHEEVPDGVVLHLTDDEAKAVGIVLGRVVTNGSYLGEKAAAVFHLLFNNDFVSFSDSQNNLVRDGSRIEFK